jgi:hypothetical protein
VICIYVPFYFGTGIWPDNKNQSPASCSIFNDVIRSFVWVWVVNPKKYAVFTIKNHCKLSEDMDLKGILVFSAYYCQIVVIKIIYTVLRRRSHQSNVVLTICKPICCTKQITYPLRMSIYYKSFTCNYNFTKQHRLLKRKLKLWKRICTAYTSTPSSSSWGYHPNCSARR